MEAIKNLSDLRNQVNHLWHSQKLAQAIELIEKYPQYYETDSEAAFFFGSIYAENKQFNESNLLFDKALAITPELSICHYQKCLLNIVNGSDVDLTLHFNFLLSLPESNYLNHFVKGLICVLNDDVEQANNCFLQGKQLNTDNQALNHDIDTIITLINQSDNDNSNQPEIAVDELSTETNSVLLDIYNSKY